MMQDISTMVAEKIAQQKEDLIFSKLMKAREEAISKNNYSLVYFLDEVLNIWTGVDKYKGMSEVLRVMKNIIETSKYEILLIDEPRTVSVGNINSEFLDSKLVFTFTQDFSNFKIIIKEKLMEV